MSAPDLEYAPEELVQVIATWVYPPTVGMKNRRIPGRWQVILNGDYVATDIMTTLPAEGALNTRTPEKEALDIYLPRLDIPGSLPADEPDLRYVILVHLETPFGGVTNKQYVIDPRMGGPAVIDLRDVVEAQYLAGYEPSTMLGVPGGVARLNMNGDVVDADGAPVGSAAVSAYRHDQNTNEDLWVVDHHLGYEPGGVFVMLSTGEQAFPKITRTVPNQSLTLDFLGDNVQGVALLS